MSMLFCWVYLFMQSSLLVIIFPLVYMPSSVKFCLLGTEQWEWLKVSNQILNVIIGILWHPVTIYSYFNACLVYCLSVVPLTDGFLCSEPKLDEWFLYDKHDCVMRKFLFLVMKKNSEQTLTAHTTSSEVFNVHISY